MTEDLIDRWTASQHPRFADTRRRRAALVRNFATWVSPRSLTEATAEDVEEWLASRPLAPSSRYLYVWTLASFYQWAREEEGISEALTLKPTRPSRASRSRQARPDRPRRCECGREGTLRRLAGEGPPLCDSCYQRERRFYRLGERIDGRRPLYEHLVGAGLAEKTVSIYMRTIGRASEWFEMNGWHLATATPGQVARFLDEWPRGWASRNLLRASLTHYWELAEHPDPPLGAIKVPPKPRMECHALDEDDARRLAAVARARGDARGLAVLLGLYQAMRREEIATIAWDAFGEDGWLTIVGKGAKRRTIPMHPVVVAAVRALERRHPVWVFPGRRGDHVDPATVWKWVGDVVQEAEIGRIRPHWLRHTCLATQNDATGDLRTVQAFAGHTKPDVTAGYTRTTRRRLLAAVAAIDY